MNINTLQTEKKFTTALQAAIAYLIGMGIVESDSEVAALMKEHKANLSAYKNGSKPASKGFITKFKEQFGLELSDFNPETYQPRFLNPSNPPYTLVKNGDGSQKEVHTKLLSYLNETTERIIQIDTHGNEIIPITDLQMAAGGGVYNEQNFETMDTMQLPERLLKNGVHLCVKIRGESMAPTLLDGGLMVIRELHKTEYGSIKTDHIYAIVYRDENGNAVSVLKRIKNRLNKGFLVCMSDNPDKATYSNFNIEHQEILSVWHGELYISAKMPNIHDQYYSRLQRLEDLVEDLARKIK